MPPIAPDYLGYEVSYFWDSENYRPTDSHSRMSALYLYQLGERGCSSWIVAWAAVNPKIGLVILQCSLWQTVDRPKDWYKTMFKQIHMVHKPGMYVLLCFVLLFSFNQVLMSWRIYTQLYIDLSHTKTSRPPQTWWPLLFSMSPSLPLPLNHSCVPLLTHELPRSLLRDALGVHQVF